MPSTRKITRSQNTALDRRVAAEISNGPFQLM